MLLLPISYYIIIVILFIIMIISYAIIWKLQFHYSNSIFKKWNPNFWNPQISWINKWKPDHKNGKLIEKFKFSSTILVWITDAFHLFQFIFHTSWQGIISILLAGYCTSMLYIIPIFIVIKITFSISFELLFTKLFNKTN